MERKIDPSAKFCKLKLMQKKRKPFFLTTLLFVFALSLLTSCDPKTTVERYSEEKILTLGNSNEPNGLDPQVATGVIESNIFRGLFEGLCSDHPEKEEVHLPGAAESWTASEDLKTWVFKLQPEGKWSDGKPVTTEDFCFAYHRILHPKFGAKYASMLYFIEGAEAYNKTKLGEILCGKHPQFPLAWDVLKQANFQGDAKIDLSSLKDKETENYTDAEKQLFFQSKGLDKLSLEHLKEIQQKPQLFSWSKDIPELARQEVLKRLIAYKEKPYDLWEKAEIGVTAVDSHTLKINLRSPVPFLPDLTKHFTWYPVPKHVILAHGEIDNKFSKWTDAENIVGNGPFKMKTWQFNHKIELERNPHYWDAKQVRLNGIRFLPIANVHTEARMFYANQLHATYTLAPSLIQYSHKKYPAEFRQETYLGTSFIRFNMKKKTLQNLKIRQALSLAIDRQLIIDQVLRAGQKPATGMVPPMAGYEALKQFTFDPEKAKKILAEAGYSKEKPLKLELLTTDKESNKSQAEAYQEMWRKHLGAEISIKQFEWKTYLNKLSNLEYDLAMGGWIGDYPDPTTFLDMWKTGDGNNRTGWSNEAYEALLKKAERTANPQERIKILQQAETLLLNDAPFTCIFWATNVYLLHPSVKNWHPRLLKNQPYKFIDLK